MKFIFILLVISLFMFTSCDPDTVSPCKDITCSDHGKCEDDTGRAVCDCDSGYHQDGLLNCISDSTGCNPGCESYEVCIADECKLRDGYCGVQEDCTGDQTCDANHQCRGAVNDPCKGVDCGEGSCIASGYGYASEARCDCNAGYHPEGLKCIKDSVTNLCDNVTCSNHGQCSVVADAPICSCENGYDVVGLSCIKNRCFEVVCDEWKECSTDSGECVLKTDRCESNTNCTDTVCDLSAHNCITDPCSGVSCSNQGVCTAWNGEAVCNCNDGYTPSDGNCVASSAAVDWCGINWYGGPTGSDTPNPISVRVNSENGANNKVYAQIYEADVTTANHEQSMIRAQLGYTEGDLTYPIRYNELTWVDATYNEAGKGDYGNNHEYMADFPTTDEGTFKFIFRFSIDNGHSWSYCDSLPSPEIINSNDISYGTATIKPENMNTKLLKLDNGITKTENSYSFVINYIGDRDLDLAGSKIYLNGELIDLSTSYDATTKKFTISKDSLTKGKYTYLFRMVDIDGNSIDALYIPIWIESEKFEWKDAFLYQIMTDRFNNGDENNDSPVIGVDTDKNWQGGDFKGIIAKIESGYFDDMGANVLWISSPILNTNGKGKGVSDGQWYSGYHSYWPIATGWTDKNHIEGIDSPIDNHFGTEAELKELIRVAHRHGIRVLADFVANHIFAVTNPNNGSGSVSPLYSNSAYFHNPPYVCGWERPITCWFTDYLPDFNYTNPELLNYVMDHAIWMVQEFDFDGYRLDAVKHMIMDFTTTIRERIREEVETTGDSFYMIGETFDGDAGYLNSFVGDDKLTGQFEFGFYFTARDTILHNGNLNDLKNFADWNDTYYTTRWNGALMANFLGNHDVRRALNEANGNQNLLRLAQTVLMTSPRIPLIYQGDEFGMPGEGDPDNRRFMRFNLTDNNETSTREHLQKLGLFRKAHKAVRRGVRTTCDVGNDFWIYKMKFDGDVVVVGINKGSSEVSGNCNVNGNFKDAFSGTTSNFNGTLVVPANSSVVLGKE